MPWLPVSITFGRPSRAELLVLAGALVLVASAAAGWVRTTSRHAAPVPPDPGANPAPLSITSTPGGASVVVDGQDQGTTPATLAVSPGRHEIAVRTHGAIDEARTVDVDPAGSTLVLSFWRDHPTVTYLKPPLPGATVADTRFLDDGRLALQVALPDGERQTWTLDPIGHLALQRLGASASHAPLAVRPDGAAVAFLQPRAEVHGSSPLAFADHVPAGEVWLASVEPGAPARRVWVLPDPSEELVDLEWAPDDQHLLLLGRQVTSGAARTVMRWLDVASGQARALALLPSQVAAGSYVWSPDGQTVGFVVHTASLAAVCTLSVAGDFRYLGDLGHDGTAGPPVAPVAWAPDGRVLHGALTRQTPTSGPASPFNQHPAGLFLADPAEAPGRPFGSTAALAPLWRPDGQLFAVGLPGGQDGGLRLRTLDAQGQARDVATLDVPTPGPTAYGVRWDLAHARALVATDHIQGDGPAHDFWLVDFDWEPRP